MKKMNIQSVVPKKLHERGYLLVLVMVTSLLLMAITVALMSVSSTKYAKTASDGDAAAVVYAAEAGISDTLNRLNQSSLFTGYSTKKQFYSAAEKGKAEYTTSVTSGASGTLIVSSTGYLSAAPSSTTPFMTRTIKAVLVRDKTPITENVIAGSGGLTMSGNYMPWWGQPTAMQKGSVYSRGKVRLNGGATSIGSATDSARVVTPNIGCGTTANFPQQCASNDPPLVFGSGGWYSSGTGSIYGTVCATDQSASPNIFTGPTGAGLQSGCIAPDYGMPYFDKKTFTSTKVVPVSALAAQCTIPWFGPILPVVWAANTRIIGNVNLQGSFLGNCTANIMGDVYIKGDLTLNSRSQLVVSDTLGSRKPIVVVDGKVTIKKDSAGVQANSSSSPVTIVSFWSTDTTCSTNDECVNINSTHLYNSSMQGLGSSWWSSATNRAIYFENTYGGTTPPLAGLATYSYFGSTYYGFDGAGSMRGIGGQELVINPGSAFSFSGGSLSVTDVSPFMHVLQRNKFVIGDYLQSF